MKVTMRQIGPGMVQQMQSVCSDCAGEGNALYSTVTAHVEVVDGIFRARCDRGAACDAFTLFLIVL
jgi:hypothetical protein